jgi:hypothetical protein
MRKRINIPFLFVILVILILMPACQLIKSQKKTKTQGLDENIEELKILIEKGESKAAQKLFADLEMKLKKGVGVYKVWYYFALNSEDEAIRAMYGKKFLDEINLPPNLSRLKIDVFQVLADDAGGKGNLQEARELLNQALTIAGEKSVKTLLQSRLAQLELMRKPAPEISADTWINTSSLGLALKNLNGQAILLVFRSPWCEASGKLTPVLNNLFNKYKSQGLMIIDCIKLYGYFQTDTNRKDALPAGEEIELIREYIAKNKIIFPVALNREGTHFESYKVAVLPSIIFIAKDGTVADIEIGSGNHNDIESKVKNILEVKSDGKS